MAAIVVHSCLTSDMTQIEMVSLQPEESEDEISKSVPLELERDIVARQCWEATTFKTNMLQRAPDYKINGRDDCVPFIRHSRSRCATKLDPINDYDLRTRLRRAPKCGGENGGSRWR